jgi:hypothetical protein
MLGAGIFILSIVSNIPSLIIRMIIRGIAFVIINATNLSWPGDSSGRLTQKDIFGVHHLTLP